MKAHILFALTVLTTGSLRVSAAPASAIVTTQKGNATATDKSGNPRSVRVGNHLAEGTIVATDAKSEVGLTPIPGSCISLLEKSQLVVETLKFVRAGEEIQSREAVLRLTVGTLFFGLERGKSAADRLEIITPAGNLNAKEAAATVAIRGGVLYVTVQGGNVSFASAAGSNVTLTPGSILATGAKGTQVTNLVSGSVSTYDLAGKLINQRIATAGELITGRHAIESAVIVTTQVIGSNLLNHAFVASLSEALTQVNQALGAAGLPPVDSQSVGSAPGTPGGGAGSGGVASMPPPSFSSGTVGGGTVNPANLSGHLHSPER